MEEIATGQIRYDTLALVMNLVLEFLHILVDVCIRNVCLCDMTVYLFVGEMVIYR